MSIATLILILSIFVTAGFPPAVDGQQWLDFHGKKGPGVGKHIVFVTGDEEYRSEEGMPQLARILADHHGFRCTVHFSINHESGEIDPGTLDNIPGLEALDEADLMVIFTRFRDLPDDQMKPIVDFVDSGKPVIGLRTSTHAFDMNKHKKYLRFSWRNPQWEGGFGRQVLGETWIAHHGGHGWQSSRGIIAKGAEKHPIVRGIADGDAWDPSDVYTVRLPLPSGCQPILLGQVLAGMDPDDPPCDPEERDGRTFDKNDPMMPVAWTRIRELDSGKSQRVFSTTFGTSQSFARPGSRRLLVNACYWALAMEDEIPERSKVDLVGEYKPTPFGYLKHRKGVTPQDLKQQAQ